MLKPGIRHRLRRYVPIGSPIWTSCYFVRRGIRALFDPASKSPILWYVVHQNILLEHYKAIYFYIPKVACSTLKKVCVDLLNMNHAEGDLVEEVHLLAFPYVKKYKVADDYQDYFRFCFVRNPWSRLVSCYKDKIDYDQGHVYERYENSFIAYLKNMKMYSKDMNFERFVEVVCEIPDELAEGHFRSQHRFILDDHDRKLVDFIGKFEQLHLDFDKVTEKLGIQAELPHLRSRKDSGYADYYTNRISKLVGRRYERDIDMFGYQF